MGQMAGGTQPTAHPLSRLAEVASSFVRGVAIASRDAAAALMAARPYITFMTAPLAGGLLFAGLLTSMSPPPHGDPTGIIVAGAALATPAVLMWGLPGLHRVLEIGRASRSAERYVERGVRDLEAMLRDTGRDGGVG